jgi:TetR/AcrR family transcriptional regulator, cholesterol catabolism regulator
MSEALEPTGALARSQAARRRRVLDATLQLARGGGFDAVQMRDVAAEANVALGTVYRYFSSKERLLLEAMAEQLEDLRRYLESHRPPGDTPAARVIAVLRRANAALARQPDVTAAMVRAYGACRDDNAPVIDRVGRTTNAIIMTAIGRTGAREERLARALTQVWLSSLIGWAGGVDPIARVDDDLEHAARMLLGEE